MIDCLSRVKAAAGQDKVATGEICRSRCSNWSEPPSVLRGGAASPPPLFYRHSLKSHPSPAPLCLLRSPL